MIEAFTYVLLTCLIGAERNDKKAVFLLSVAGAVMETLSKG